MLESRGDMRLFLKLLFAGIFVFMIVMTVWVGMHKPLSRSIEDFSWAASPWAVATLFDAYFGFTTFFVWVCFKERGLAIKAMWFLLIVGLGNIAMSAYVLIQLFKLKPEEPLRNLLLPSAQ